MSKDAERVFIPVKMNNVSYQLLLDTGFDGTVGLWGNNFVASVQNSQDGSSMPFSALRTDVRDFFRIKNRQNRSARLVEPKMPYCPLSLVMFTRYTLGKNRIPASFITMGAIGMISVYGEEINKVRLIPSLSLGGKKPFVRIEDVPGLFPHPQNTVKKDEFDHGMIGGSLLKFFDIYFSPEDNRVSLVKNRFFTANRIERAFGVVTVKDNATRRITAIMPDSAAANGGAMVGDSIIECFGIPIAELINRKKKSEYAIISPQKLYVKLKSATRDEIYTIALQPRDML